MNLAEAANLVLTLSLKDQVSSGLAAIDKKMGGLNTRTSTLQGGLTKISKGIGVGLRNAAKIGGVGLLFLGHQAMEGIDALVELEDVTNQTDAVIKSTGSSAGLTAEEIRDLSERMEELSGVDDKVVQSGANVLLTFTNIREDAFEPATLAALNMSQAMDQDLQSSMVQIGKALQDPIRGMTALRRVGVMFTEEQEAVIKSMVETGDVAGAQALILEELNREFGGSAQASMEGYRGTQLRLADTVEELQMALAEALLPALENVSKELRGFLNDPKVKEGIKNLGKSIAGLFSTENVKGGGEALKGLFTFLRDLPWDSIKSGLSFAAENAKKVVDVFRSLPPGVQAGLLTFLAANKLTGGLVASGIGELLKVGLMSLRTITAANVTVIGANVTGGVPGAGVPGAAGGKGLIKGAGILTVAVAAAPLVIAGLTEIHNATLRDQGLSQRQIDLHNDNISLTADLKRAVMHGADPNSPMVVSLTSRLNANNAELAVIKANTNATNASVIRTIPFIGDVGDDVRKTIPFLGEIGRNVNGVDSAVERTIPFLGTIARKDTSVSVNIRTSFSVSAREIASSMLRLNDLHGNLEY